jgi:hypothetical protein
LELSNSERDKLFADDSGKEKKKAVVAKIEEVVPVVPEKFDPNAKMDMAALFSMRSGA